MTPDEIIDQARHEDPAFTRERHPRKVAIHFLSRLQRRLVAAWAQHEETSYVELFTVEFPLASFEAGVSIESGESVPEPLAVTMWHRPGDLFWTGRLDEPDDIELIRWADRNRRRATRVAWIRENTMFFSGDADDWTDVARVEFTYTPTPADIVAGDEELVLPLTAEELLVTRLAAFFARRSNDDELARPRREYIAEANDVEADWLNDLRHKQGAIVSRTRCVW